jgi:hypothetical protein
MGAGDIYHEGDFQKALVGKAPNTEQLLGRGGMEEGPMRTGLGFVGDVVADPALILSGTAKVGGKLIGKLASSLGKEGAAKAIANASTKVAAFAPALNASDQLIKAIPGAEKATNAVSAALAKGFDKAGRFVYQSRAMQALDDVGERFGKKPLGDIMYEQKMSGTSSSLENQVKDYNKKLLAERAGILEGEVGKAPVDIAGMEQKFEQGGAKYFDPSSVEGRNIEKQTAHQNAKEISKENFSQLKPTPASYMGAEAIPAGNVSQLGDVMTSVNQIVGSGAYKGGALNPAATKEIKRLTAAAREEMYNAATKADPVAAARLRDINEEISAILSTSKKLESEGAKTATSVAVGPVTGMAIGSGMPGVAVGKALGDLSKSTWGRTKAGIALKDMGEAVSRKDPGMTSITDAVARQIARKKLELKDEE